MFSSITKKLIRFMALTTREKRVFLGTTAMLPLVRLAISRFGLARSLALMEARACSTRRSPAISDMRALGQLVNLAADHSPVASNCLARSLMLKWLLLRQGIECQLHIGVRITGGVLEAHAWIQYQGEPINDRQENCESFSAFDTPINLAAEVHDFV